MGITNRWYCSAQDAFGLKEHLVYLYRGKGWSGVFGSMKK